MLVPIQLPNDLVIAVTRIQEVDRRPEGIRRLRIVHRIVLPAVEVEAAVAEQIVLATNDPVRPRGSAALAVRKLALDRRDEIVAERRADQKARLPHGEMPRKQLVCARKVAGARRLPCRLELGARREDSRERPAIPSRCPDRKRGAIDRQAYGGGGAPRELARVHLRKTRDPHLQLSTSDDKASVVVEARSARSAP